MKQRILDLAELCGIDNTTRRRSIPMPVAGYKLEESFASDPTLEDEMYLPLDKIKKYMQIVGCLVWISGIRYDISFPVLYLSWHTRKPRKHHMTMALYVVAYLFYSKDVPLVLGGKGNLNLTTYTDSSLATGPKRRSVSGQLTKLNENSGAIHVKSHATQSTCMSSFESELDALTDGMKTALYLQQLLATLNTDCTVPATIYADNQAMIDFVNGEGSLRGSRHMDLRLWFSRENLQRGRFLLRYMPGITIPANFLTKLATISEHSKFLVDIQGLSLLPESHQHLTPITIHLSQDDESDLHESK
jgi:hypothetical protein